MYSVSSCDTSSPPTTARPSGRRDSAPAPQPSAIGIVPTSAAIVVIMIGRKRDQTRFVNRLARRLAMFSLSFHCEVDHHDAIFLDESDEHDDADKCIQTEFGPEDEQCQQRAEAGCGQPGENRERVRKALVKNPQHDVDDDDGHQQNEAEALQRLLERLRRALERRRDRGRHRSRRRLLDRRRRPRRVSSQA